MCVIGVQHYPLFASEKWSPWVIDDELHVNGDIPSALLYMSLGCLQGTVDVIIGKRCQPSLVMYTRNYVNVT